MATKNSVSNYFLSMFVDSMLYLDINKYMSLALTSGNMASEICMILLDFSLIVKAATLIFISGCGSAISSDKEGKSGFIYNLVKS